MNIRNIAAPIGSGLLVGLAASIAGAIGFAVSPPADAVAYTPPAVVVPDETPTASEAEAWYVSHLGPSIAWTLATPAEREVAEAAYLAEYGSWNNGCKADLRHAFQGFEDNPIYVQAGLPVKVVSGDVLLGDWVEGVCN